MALAADRYVRARQLAAPVLPLIAQVRQLGPELLKFGIVGGIGTVVDLGGAALLHGKFHVEPLVAKAISTGTATVITYLGSRFWTFKHRENQELKREAVLFIVLNLVGLLIAEAVVGFVTYVIGEHGQVAYNIGSFLGTGCGTIFRYFAYKKWVFLAPEEAPFAMDAPAPPPYFDSPPWELDPTFLTPLRPAAVAASAPLPAPTAVAAAAAVTAMDVPTPDFPAATFFAPLQEPRRPAPAPAPPRSSGGGRHRKS